MAQNHINILSITSEEDKRRLTTQFQAMERKLAEATQTNERLTRELEDQKKKALLQTPAKRNI
jgi:flagellar capping protein FliD